MTCPLCRNSLDVGGCPRCRAPVAPTAITATPTEPSTEQPLSPPAVADIEMAEGASWAVRWRWLILLGYLPALLLLWEYAIGFRLGAGESGTEWSVGLLLCFLGMQIYIPLSVAAGRRLSRFLGDSWWFFIVAGGILASAVPLVALTGWNLALPASERLELDSLAVFAVLVGAFFGTQALFLAGAPVLGGPDRRNAKPIWLSGFAGFLLVGLLCVGVVFALEELFRLLGQRRSGEEMWGFGLALLMIAWAFWFGVGSFLWQRFGGAAAFRGMYRFLLGGTCLELLITIPVDLLVRKRSKCYCFESTFFALIIGLFLALWLFGPGVLLLFLVRREQRLRRAGFCRSCGFDLRPVEGSSCPECGAAIPALMRRDSSGAAGALRCYDE